MTTAAAIAYVRDHNAWRRGADTVMPDPRTLGQAIDIVLRAAEYARADVDEIAVIVAGT